MTGRVSPGRSQETPKIDPKCFQKASRKRLRKTLKKVRKKGPRGVLDLGWHGDGKSELDWWGVG